MLTNTDCTLYAYDKATGGFIRHKMENVYWRENKAGNVLKSGLQTADSTTVYIYTDEVVPQSVSKDMLVKGACDFEFDNSSAQSISASMKAFRGAHNYITVMSIDNYMYGGNPHIEVSAK
ncbi:hypothetical protein Osc1_05030 [Hominimerdicola sp. 21CYCFAH17_S]|nr:MAG TPA: hypothetical protein [Caudoviricetes sp.]